MENSLSAGRNFTVTTGRSDIIRSKKTSLQTIDVHKFVYVKTSPTTLQIFVTVSITLFPSPFVILLSTIGKVTDINTLNERFEIVIMGQIKFVKY